MCKKNERKAGDFLKCIMFLIAISLFVAPIVVYAMVFEIGVWKSHDDWAKMGSALGGIYSPILTVATICVLWFQFRLSKRIHAENMGQFSSQLLLVHCNETLHKISELQSKRKADYLPYLKSTDQGRAEVTLPDELFDIEAYLTDLYLNGTFIYRDMSDIIAYGDLYRLIEIKVLAEIDSEIRAHFKLYFANKYDIPEAQEVW